MSNKVAATPESNPVIQPTPYAPGQLIIKLMNVDGGNPAQKALQEILELKIRRTKIKAVESNHGAIFDDVQEAYQQDFSVGEQYGKVLYNALRRYREVGPSIEILMFEPDPTYTKVIDAWLIKNGRIQHVRTSTYAHRDVTTDQPPVAEGHAAFPGTPTSVNTIFTILGELHHQLSLIELAQQVFDEMNQLGRNPNDGFMPAA